MTAAHNMNQSADAARENVRVLGETAQDGLRSRMNTAAENARRFTDRITQAYGLTGEKHQELARQATQNLEVIGEAGTVLTRGIQDISQEWFGLLQENLQKNLDGFNALAGCRSIPNFMAVQGGLMRDNLEQTIEGTRRIGAVSTKVAIEASQIITTQTKKTRQSA